MSNFVNDKKLPHTYTVWCHNQNAVASASPTDNDTRTDNMGNRTPHYNNRSVNMSAWYKIVSFDTVNKYCACVKALLDRPRMVSNGMIFIMRDGIHPDWSIANNKDAGRISWKLEKTEVLSCWENMCCLFVSGEFDSLFGNYDIQGISVSPKKASNIIKLWTGKTIEDDVLSEIVLPDICKFKHCLMIFRTNENSAALKLTKLSRYGNNTPSTQPNTKPLLPSPEYS